MTEPFLVEESTPVRLASKLEDLAKSLEKDAIHHDYMMALVIVVMAEVGFTVTSANQSETDVVGYKKKLRTIPPDWKSPDSGNYSLKFTLAPVVDQECKIVAIPSGDILVINLLLQNDCKTTLSVAVQTAKYVNIYSSDICGRYLNLKEFSFWFKNTIATPARCEILSAACLPSSSLAGLPAEIKIRIIEMLDAYSITRMAQTSKEFHQLTGESRLWMKLLKRDFPTAYIPPRNDYFESYMRNYNWVRRGNSFFAFSSTNSSVPLDRCILLPEPPCRVKYKRLWNRSISDSTQFKPHAIFRRF